MEKKNYLDILNKDIKLFGTSFNDQKKVDFFTEIHTLLSSGIDIRTSLDIITQSQKKDSDKEVFNKVKTNIIAGKSLSEAMTLTEKFSNYDTICVKIGEETGRLNDILSEMTMFYSFKIKHRRQVYSSLSYPILVLITSLVAVFFMMNFIVPMFSEVFNRFGGQLPALTQTIIHISGFIQDNTLIILFIVFSFIVFISFSRKEEWFRKYSAILILKTPLLGRIVNKIYLSRFCQAMGLLTASRIPMINAIELVKQMIGFYPYEQALNQVIKDILKGKHLHESLSKYYFFELKLVSLIKVAEEVNQLDIMFAKLNKQYSEETENSLGMLTTFLEPILIIFVGLLVAIVLISMYLPLFQMSTSVM